MKQFPKSLQQKLQQREEQNALRQLPIANDLIDFASNDYIGFSKNETIFHETHQNLFVVIGLRYFSPFHCLV